MFNILGKQAEPTEDYVNSILATRPHFRAHRTKLIPKAHLRLFLLMSELVSAIQWNLFKNK